MNVTLTIDTRENDIISYCKEKSISFITASLEVGDLMLTKNIEKVEEKEVEKDTNTVETLIFERKTITDLVASIKDGRYREQKQRLKSTFPFHRITYIIEGSMKEIINEKEKTIHGISSKAIVSSLLSSRYRDGFHIIHTENITETMWYIQELLERFSTPDKLTFDLEHGSYTSSVKVKSKKSENITPKVAYQMQLSQIPGLSMKIATDISITYPSFRELIQAIDNKGLKAFDKIPGMGKTRSKKIIEFIR